MNYLSLLLIVASLAVLGLGLWTYQLTSSRQLALNTAFGSLSLLFAAYQACVRTQPHWIFVLPFFVTMLFGGRAIALCWRARKETELRRPSRVLVAAAAVTTVATVSAFLAQG